MRPIKPSDKPAHAEHLSRGSGTQAPGGPVSSPSRPRSCLSQRAPRLRGEAARATKRCNNEPVLPRAKRIRQKEYAPKRPRERTHLRPDDDGARRDATIAGPATGGEAVKNVCANRAIAAGAGQSRPSKRTPRLRRCSWRDQPRAPSSWRRRENQETKRCCQASPRHRSRSCG